MSTERGNNRECPSVQRWHLSHRYDQAARRLADRHYNRRKVGSPQFAPPGRLLVLRTEAADAFWVSTFPEARFIKHNWPGAWHCNAFRNEGSVLSSELVREAVACTVWKWGRPDAHGMITFVNPRKVRAKRDPGRCFIKAGFRHIACTLRNRLAVLLLSVEDLPTALTPIGAQLEVACAV